MCDDCANTDRPRHPGDPQHGIAEQRTANAVTLPRYVNRQTSGMFLRKRPGTISAITHEEDRA